MARFFFRLAYGLIGEAICEWLEARWWDLENPGPLLFELSANLRDAAEQFRLMEEAIASLDRAVQNLGRQRGGWMNDV